MERTFIEVPAFTKKWHDLGLTDDDLRELENILLEDTKAGDTIHQVALHRLALKVYLQLNGIERPDEHFKKFDLKRLQALILDKI